MDKRPPCIVTAEEGSAIAVYDGNCEINFNIVRFVHELQNALTLSQIDKDISL